MTKRLGNLLAYGDNLTVLREHIPSESVDLVYLDPPFKSDANYNMLFKEQDGSRAAAQIQAFEDTWRWDAAASKSYSEAVSAGGSVGAALEALRTLVGDSDMLAYLSMMAPRLVELRRVLKPDGYLYLHCDPAASHYLKLLLDSVFGAQCFRNEIIWRRTSAHGNATTKYASVHDTLLFYTKSRQPTWHQQFEPYTEEYIATHFVHEDPDGRRFRRADLRNPGVRPNLKYDYTASNGITYKPHSNGWAISRERMEQLDREGRLFFPAKRDGRLRKKLYLDESPGVPISDNWVDIKPIFATGDERLGYPTQKPVALLERIIAASSNPGDVILDPFCGCGTAVDAAHRLGRRWIGIDITGLAINLIKKRLRDRYPDVSYREIGAPTTEREAAILAKSNPFGFQEWVLTLVNAQQTDEIKRGADRGIDGRLRYRDPMESKTQQVIISVKAGHVAVSHLRDLRGTMARENAAIGVLISLEKPTRAMREEAASAGHVRTTWGNKARLQLLTVEELFAGKKIDYPTTEGAESTFKPATRAKRGPGAVQTELLDDPFAGTPLSRQPQAPASMKKPKPRPTEVEASVKPARPKQHKRTR